MADVDMTDAPGPASGKKAAGAGGKKLDGKQKFEVKKVPYTSDLGLVYKRLTY